MGKDVLGDDLSAAILTRKQREYLAGKTDIEPGSPADRAIRSRIRKRLRSFLLDLQLLSYELDSEERDSFAREVPSWSRELVSHSPTWVDSLGQQYLLERSTDGVALLFSLILGQNAGYVPELYETDEELLERVVFDAIRRAFPQMEISIETASVDISIEGEQRFDEFDEEDLPDVPSHILRQMFDAGSINIQQFEEAIRSQYATSSEDTDTSEDET